ncbi:MAG: hypothetical protein HWN66_01530 [Candidatus Helarchaeota archaeon]|nr:hypothetical protein [Candidatus Helarchaeota archaeon]
MIGFILSIILLLILGPIIAWAYKRKLRKINKDASVLLGILIMVLFWTFGILCYLNIINFGSFGTGKEIMWNFPFNLGINPYTSGNLDVYAIFIFLSYPFWYLWGLERGYDWVGRRPHQEGITFLLRMNKPGQEYPKDREEMK